MILASHCFCSASTFGGTGVETLKDQQRGPDKQQCSSDASLNKISNIKTWRKPESFGLIATWLLPLSWRSLVHTLNVSTDIKRTDCCSQFLGIFPLLAVGSHKELLPDFGEVKQILQAGRFNFSSQRSGDLCDKTQRLWAERSPYRLPFCPLPALHSTWWRVIIVSCSSLSYFTLEPYRSLVNFHASWFFS